MAEHMSFRKARAWACLPWESLHVGALAGFDHWHKGRDTGILERIRIRYVLPELEGWRTADSWPPAAVTPRALPDWAARGQ